MMSPKIFSWLLRGKGRKIVLSPIPGPNGGTYMLELRQGVTTTVKQEISRFSVERYVGNNLRIALEQMVKQIDELLDNEDNNDDT